MRLVFQDDGSVVLYSAAGRPLWETRTYRTQAQSLSVAGNGELIVAGAKAQYWHSGTVVGDPASFVIARLDSLNGHYRVVMQTDGNFVVYSALTGPLWSSGTSGRPGSFLLLQGDGNLVIYRAGHAGATWSTHTAGRTQAALEMQNDGNLVLYRGIGRYAVAQWQSHTAGRP